MDFKKKVCGLAVFLLGLSGTTLHAFQAADQFDHDTISICIWQMVGRRNYSIDSGVLRVCDGSVTAGDAKWNHNSLKFRACAAQDAAQVQIWAGFRHYNRNCRHVVGLRGGSNSHLYLARNGAEGYDNMLGLRLLEFALAPDSGISIRLLPQAIKLPYIDIKASITTI